jgi:hypothetical protein
MNRTIRLLLQFALVAFTSTSGCAPAYHHYSECHVNCRYCAPPALPYMHYDGCVCHSCAASKYLEEVPAMEVDAGQPVK